MIRNLRHPKKLQASLDDLNKTQMEMETMSSTDKGICELESHPSEKRAYIPLFHKWPITYLFAIASLLSDTYRKEVLQKHTIGIEVVHIADQDLTLS